MRYAAVTDTNNESTAAVSRAQPNRHALDLLCYSRIRFLLVEHLCTQSNKNMNHCLSSSSRGYCITLGYSLLKRQLRASDHRPHVHHGHGTGLCVLQDSLSSRKPVVPSKPLKHVFHCSKGTPSYQQRSGSSSHRGHQTRALHLALNALRIVACRRHAICSTAVVGSIRNIVYDSSEISRRVEISIIVHN